MSPNDIHVCEVCFRESHRHPKPDGVTATMLNPPCCIGCSCGSGEAWRDRNKRGAAKRKKRGQK
jgi:hypothetical protein